MNDIYKGKSFDSGEWVEGNLIYSTDAEKGWGTVIIPTTDSNMFVTNNKNEDLGFENWHRVVPETVCRYTGRTDENDRKIFENDIIGFLDVTQYDNGYSEHYCRGKVFWDEESLSFQVTERLSCESYEALDGECKVIGNVFDNPELLGGE